MTTRNIVPRATSEGSLGTYSKFWNKSYVNDIIAKGPQVDLRAYGAAGDNSTDDTTAVASAVTAADGAKIVGKKGKYKITSISDSMGADFDDKLQIMLNSVLYNSYANRAAIFGTEYLYYFHNKVRQKTAVTITFSGDSTTLGTGIADTSYVLPTMIANMATADSIYGVTTINDGQSGEDTSEWVSTYLATDLATTPDLLVLRWGANDIYNGRTAAQFATSLRSGLATIRASRAVSALSIVLMSPNSMSDDTYGRNEVWFESINSIIRRAARDYQCCFIDTYALFQDSRKAAGYWMDNPLSDGSAIHPLGTMNILIASLIYDVLFPTAIRLLKSKPFYIAPTLLNSWANFGGATATVAYYKERNRVYLRGCVTGGTIGDSTPIFTLPAGYRPSALIGFVTCSGSTTITLIGINSDGNVFVPTGVGGNTALYLDSISFVATS